jgi:hypothetical protein
MKDQLAMVAAMKETHVQLKAQFQDFSIEDIESLHDDMSDLMEDTSVRIQSFLLLLSSPLFCDCSLALLTLTLTLTLSL